MSKARTSRRLKEHVASLETMTRLFELKNVVGVKDATANIARVSLQRQAMGTDFCQLSGEALARLLGLPVPGPVLGMGLMLVLLSSSARIAALVVPVGTGILRHIALLFVPAGVGVVGHLDRLGPQAAALALAIAVSTALAIAAGALAFVLVARLAGSGDDHD